MNIGCLPVLYDAQGAFGNPTSDSRRAMITDGVRRIMTVIYSFAPREELERAVEEYRALLQELCGVEDVTTEIFAVKEGCGFMKKWIRKMKNEMRIFCRPPFY